jgi:putative transposase
MARRRRTPEQIIRKVREADRLLGEGGRGCRRCGPAPLEISEITYHRWRAQFGGTKAEETKDLEVEDAWLRQIVADKELATDTLGRSPREPGELQRRAIGLGRRSCFLYACRASTRC